MPDRQMRPAFRLLVTGSRTWDDPRTIGQALAVILARHPGGVLLVHGACPRGADAIAAACAVGTPGYQIGHDLPAHRRGCCRSRAPASPGGGGVAVLRHGR